MICIGIRWCRIVPNGRESERERRVFVLFKIEGELKPRVPPPPLFYIHPTVPFFFPFLSGVDAGLCVSAHFFSYCVDGILLSFYLDGIIFALSTLCL